MAILISSEKEQKVFNKDIVTIGSSADCDFKSNIGNDRLSLQWSDAKQKYILVSNEGNSHVIYRNAPLVGKFLLDNSIKLSIAGQTDFIKIEAIEIEQEKPLEPLDIEPLREEMPAPKTMEVVSGDVKSKLENSKTQIESSRTAIIKQVGFAINDIKHRISLNFKASIFVHIAMIVSAIVVAFGVSNFLTGLKIEETRDFINLPMNIKILALFAVLVYGLCLLLKQGVFNYFQNKTYSSPSAVSAQRFFITTSAIFFSAIYVINLLYYMSINPVFAILMSLFFVGLNVVLACAAGYFKCTGHLMSFELDKNEYREDLEGTLHKYRSWIEDYVNSISNQKIKTLKENLFNIQIKSIGETVLGVLTAPFLAYGVSNTLASCFPEAAGWIRISGLRFSPIFLVLATMLIVFAFFSFVNAFWIGRKIQASNVIKNDGFSDYSVHGLNIFGIQAVRKLESEQTRSLIIGCAIVAIEFTMNTSYFMTEIGGDLQGILLSLISATVPTALLLAETYMLSSTKFDIYVSQDVLAKRDV